MTTNRNVRAALRSIKPFGKGHVAQENVSPMAGKCRVCGLSIEPYEPHLFRPWGIEKAHLLCGWLRPEETEPHRCVGYNAPLAWEWACVSCGRDVIRREVTEDRRCTKCQQDGGAADERRTA